MKIGDRVYVHGYVDEIRKDTIIIKNSGGYFGTDKSEIVVAQKREDIVNVIRCKDCKYYEIVELNADGTPDKRFKPSICANGWYEYAVERDQNWFCADAEPKETE